MGKKEPQGDKVRSANGVVTEGLTKDTLAEESFPKVLSDCFSRYAKMVLTDRAIPDLRDGLKPVQRRILFDMWRNNIVFEKKTVKCAKTVGDVLGNYHPHGDSSVYDAMVRLSQDWKMEVPLLWFQGNNGSIDNDPPAAYRYTECKLSKAAYFLLKDIDEDTIDMTLTFDDTKTEPVVLPAGFPNLLINGAQGIAIGNATNIPTHNPTEAIEATIFRLKNPSCTVDDLLKILPGPDFPTGGILDDREALRSLYATGKATFYIYAKTLIDEAKSQIVITQIPYGVVKSQMVLDLDQRRIKDGLDNIEEIRDESAEDIRIVIQVKKGVPVGSVRDYLMSKGLLRTTFAANMLALDQGHPRTLGLLPILDSYLAHRGVVITRRSRFEMAKAKDRLEIVEGLLKAKSIIDEVIKVIRQSESRAAAKTNLMTAFGFTANQADAIGNMRLYSLTRIDILALEEEKTELLAQIAVLNRVLSSPKALHAVIEKELKEAEKALATPRRTQILASRLAFGQVDQKNLIADEDVAIAITQDGYAKRSALRSYASAVNGIDLVGDLPTIKTGDRLVANAVVSTHDDVLVITDRGNYATIPVWQLPEAKWHEEGKHLNALVSLDSSEKLVAAFLIKAVKPSLSVILLSKLGRIKRTALTEFTLDRLTARPLKAMSLLPDDRVVAAFLGQGNSDVFVLAQDGNLNRFNENDIPLVGLKTAGVKAMNLPANKGIALADGFALPKGKDEKVFVVCERRKGAVVNTAQVPQTERLGSKTQLVKIPQASYSRIAGVNAVTKKDGKPLPALLALTSGTMAFDEDKLAVSDIGVMLRSENIPTDPKQALIVGFHETGTPVGPDTLVQASPTPKEPKKAKTEDPKDVQPSFFDVLDADAGGNLRKGRKKA